MFKFDMKLYNVYNEKLICLDVCNFIMKYMMHNVCHGTWYEETMKN